MTYAPGLEWSLLALPVSMSVPAGKSRLWPRARCCPLCWRRGTAGRHQRRGIWYVCKTATARMRIGDVSAKARCATPAGARAAVARRIVRARCPPATRNACTRSGLHTQPFSPPTSRTTCNTRTHTHTCNAQVYIQYSIRDLEDDLLYSTRSEEGGSGQAYAFLLERGVRVPRGWEIAIQGAWRGRRGWEIAVQGVWRGRRGRRGYWEEGRADGGQRGLTGRGHGIGKGTALRGLRRLQRAPGPRAPRVRCMGRASWRRRAPCSDRTPSPELPLASRAGLPCWPPV